jgi:hypothetical protein
MMKLTGIPTNPSIKLDGQDISAIIRGKSRSHPPIFTMKDTVVRTIRSGKWKLFLVKPDYYRETDLKNWTDKRAPDGTTILAPPEQATPADYPGIKPEKMTGEMLLFDLEKDPTESTDLSGEYPLVKEDMVRKYHEFLRSIQQPNLRSIQ